ncbi:Protein brother [Trichinella papuae]|uniref:Protein brother n=1 Tax=Trichinella papuae TaxID=268474 RepID=A0A0V1MWI8_9BILA|nr:Protein brother [Trichinella papuae]
MSRVVPDQKGKFETDELFVSVSRPTEIVYTGLLCGTEEERRRQFLRDCLDRHLSLVMKLLFTCVVFFLLFFLIIIFCLYFKAFLHSGLNLELDMTGGGDSSQAADALDLDSDPVKVFISSCMILNGVCVRLRGWIDRITLKGTALLEFDPVHADIERQRIVSLGSATHPTSTRPLLMFTSTSAGIVQGPSNYPSTTGNSVRSPHAFLAPSTSHSIRPTSTGSRND